MANLNGEFGGNPGLIEAFDLFNGRFFQTLKLTRTRTRDFDRWGTQEMKVEDVFQLGKAHFWVFLMGLSPTATDMQP